jgi:uncharacterized protein
MTTVESPCTKICVIDSAARLCIGCGRSLAEIEHWVAFPCDERARIMTDLQRRLATRSRRARAVASAP